MKSYSNTDTDNYDADGSDTKIKTKNNNICEHLSTSNDHRIDDDE